MIEAQTRAILDATTVLPDKARFFNGEPFAREAMRDLVDLAGEAHARDLLLTHGTILIKSESIALRVVERIEARIRAAGFTPVFAHSLRLDRKDIRLLWLYVLNGATLERLDLLDLFKPAATGILLICRDDRMRHDAIPAAVRLQRLKGSTMPAQREPGQIRFELGPNNRLLNFVHAADEPADVLRELGLLFDRPARRTLISRLLEGNDAGEELQRARRQAYAACPAHDLEPVPALERLRRRVAWLDPPALAAAALTQLDGLLSLAPADAERAWREVHALLWPHADQLGLWDYVVVGSSVCEHDPAGATRVLPDPVHGGWDEAWLQRSASVAVPVVRSASHDRFEDAKVQSIELGQGSNGKG
ncbi:nucleoside-diphosphate kinase [Rhizobium grahamii]|uniref:Nucleoside diphosphate kinase n=1 Tax=Rhizobium grahamii CCGE 502 TaxID=990285 RepID=S3H609_9HYPH|nr:nucleoside-diphosphate kinase [Rhizobium grahamii]EPE94377.1 nucleoside diphosphate kinase [Rhizobium grahamii CCGE 502]